MIAMPVEKYIKPLCPSSMSPKERATIVAEIYLIEEDISFIFIYINIYIYMKESLRFNPPINETILLIRAMWILFCSQCLSS